MSGRDAPSSKRPRHTAQRAATPESDAAVAAAPHCHAVVAPRHESATRHHPGAAASRQTTPHHAVGAVGDRGRTHPRPCGRREP
jgi:hypothetical protein